MSTPKHTTKASLPLKRCAKCGEEKPRTLQYFSFKKHTSDQLESWCKICYQAYSREYRNKNATKLREVQRLYRQRNVKAIQAKKHADYLQNPEPAKRRTRAWYVANLEKAKLYRQEYRLTTQNRITRKAAYARREARKLGLPSSFTAKQWSECLQYWNFACAVCYRQEGLFGLTLSQDHWLPLALPGCPGTVPWNIVPLCHGETGCNTSKKHQNPERWLTEKLGARRAKKKLREIAAYFVLVQVRHDA